MQQKVFSRLAWPSVPRLNPVSEFCRQLLRPAVFPHGCSRRNKNTHCHKQKIGLYPPEDQQQHAHMHRCNSLTEELFGSSLRTKTVFRPEYNGKTLRIQRKHAAWASVFFLSFFLSLFFLDIFLLRPI